MATFRAPAQRAAALATMAFVTTASTAGFVAPVISLLVYGNCGFGFDCGVYDPGYGYAGGAGNAVTSSGDYGTGGYGGIGGGYSGGGYVPDPVGAEIPPVIFPTSCWVRRAGYDLSGASVGQVLINLCRPSESVTVTRVSARARPPEGVRRSPIAPISRRTQGGGNAFQGRTFLLCRIWRTFLFQNIMWAVFGARLGGTSARGPLPGLLWRSMVMALWLLKPSCRQSAPSRPRQREPARPRARSFCDPCWANRTMSGRPC